MADDGDMMDRDDVHDIDPHCQHCGVPITDDDNGECPECAKLPDLTETLHEMGNIMAQRDPMFALQTGVIPPWNIDHSARLQELVEKLSPDDKKNVLNQAMDYRINALLRDAGMKRPESKTELPVRIKQHMKLISFITAIKEDELSDTEFARLDEIVTQGMSLHLRGESGSLAEFIGYLQSDRKIEAIKALRALTGGGLKETKDIIEDIGPRVVSYLLNSGAR